MNAHQMGDAYKMGLVNVNKVGQDKIAQ